MIVLLTPKTPVLLIPIANKPPRLGGKIQFISQGVFIQLFGLPLQEGIWLDESLPQTVLDKISHENVKASSMLEQQIQTVIDQPFYECVYCQDR